MAENLYNKIKSDIPLQDSFCVLPSGEFSMWLGNKFSYEGELTVCNGGMMEVRAQSTNQHSTNTGDNPLSYIVCVIMTT